MGKVLADQSVSLDGFSAGTNVRVGNPLGDRGNLLHDWYEQGGAQVREELFGAAGAMVMGRTMFDVGVEPWGDDPPFHMPVFVVTHDSEILSSRKEGRPTSLSPMALTVPWSGRRRQRATKMWP